MSRGKEGWLGCHFPYSFGNIAVCHRPQARLQDVVFGLYRFILAILVALSHFGLIVAGLNPGQWAVVGFYVLSGLLMERQFQKLAPEGGSLGFYVDRLLRIFPLYLATLAIYALVIPISTRDLWLNIALFPLNYAQSGIQVLISPAWSLACEAHFYLLVPLIALASSFPFSCWPRFRHGISRRAYTSMSAWGMPARCR